MLRSGNVAAAVRVMFEDGAMELVARDAVTLIRVGPPGIFVGIRGGQAAHRVVSRLPHLQHRQSVPGAVPWCSGWPWRWLPSSGLSFSPPCSSPFRPRSRAASPRCLSVLKQEPSPGMEPTRLILWLSGSTCGRAKRATPIPTP